MLHTAEYRTANTVRIDSAAHFTQQAGSISENCLSHNVLNFTACSFQCCTLWLGSHYAKCIHRFNSGVDICGRNIY